MKSIQGVLTSDYVVSASEVSADGHQLMVDRDPMETLRQIITRVGQHQNDGYVTWYRKTFCNNEIIFNYSFFPWKTFFNDLYSSMYSLWWELEASSHRRFVGYLSLGPSRYTNVFDESKINRIRWIAMFWTEYNDTLKKKKKKCLVNRCIRFRTFTVMQVSKNYLILLFT